MVGFVKVVGLLSGRLIMNRSLEWAQEQGCRPYGTRSFRCTPPGTSVPGFHMPPLRGWSETIVEMLRVQDRASRLISQAGRRGCDYHNPSLRFIVETKQHLLL